MEKTRFAILSILLIIVIGLISMLHWSDIKHAAHLDTVSEVQIVDEIEPLIDLTVEEYLNIRDDMRFDHKVDSVFINMPDQILTYILVNKGTDLSIEEIVIEYINNKDKYDKEIKRAMDIQKKYIPDSIPSVAKPDKPTETPPNVAEK